MCAKSLTVEQAKNIADDQRDVILAKAIVRTGVLSEKFFPASDPDTRAPEVQAYVSDKFDNAKSPLYGDLKAAALWAALQGVEFHAEQFTHAQARAIEVKRGMVIVPVNTRTWKWGEDFKWLGKPLICTQNVSKYGTKFRDAEGKQVILNDLNTLNCRPGTEDEMQQVIDGNLAVRKFEFIRNLGDALEDVDLGSDAE